jgi:hypothetical protein
VRQRVIITQGSLSAIHCIGLHLGRAKNLYTKTAGPRTVFLGYEALGEEEWKMKFLKKRRWEIVA